MGRYYVQFVDGEVGLFNDLCEGYEIRSTIANFYDGDGRLIATIPADKTKTIYRNDVFARGFYEGVHTN